MLFLQSRKGLKPLLVPVVTGRVYLLGKMHSQNWKSCVISTDGIIMALQNWLGNLDWGCNNSDSLENLTLFKMFLHNFCTCFGSYRISFMYFWNFYDAQSWIEIWHISLILHHRFEIALCWSHFHFPIHTKLQKTAFTSALYIVE